ncbi:MAG: energy-coupling factor transporter transmembrane component T family protein [Actinopolymorphaceae bacterium]
MRNADAVRPAATSAASWLGRRNPTIKLTLLFVVSLVMLFVFDPVTPTILYLVALAAVAVSTRLSARTLMLAHLPFIGFAVGLFCVNALSRPGEIIWDGWLLRITTEGVTMGAALAMRTLVIGILSIAFVASTDPVALMTSLQHNARLSPRVTYAVLAGYRMLQEMPAEWHTIRQAQAVRAGRGGSTLPRGARALTRAAFTLLVVSVRKGERISQALESRGLGLSPRSTWRPVSVRKTDWFLTAGVLTVLAGVVVLVPSSAALQGWW